MKIAIFDGYQGSASSGHVGRGLASYAEALTGDLASSASDAMDETVGALRWSITALRARLALQVPVKLALLAAGPIGWVTSLFTGNPEEVRNAAYSALASYEQMTLNLDTRGRGDVLAGTEPVDKWQEGARWVAKGIADLAKQLDDEGTADMVTDTVEGSWIDFKERLKQLGKDLPSPGTLSWAIPVTIAGLAALMIIPRVLDFFPSRRRYNGYSDRRRRRRR